MRSLPFVLFAVLYPYLCMYGADPAKDPVGWDNIPFGATFEQVVEKLGKRARKSTSPLNEDSIDEPLDLIVASEVQSLAEQFLKAQKNEASSTPKDVLEAARAMKKLTKPRPWKVHGKMVMASIHTLGPYVNVKIQTAAGKVGNFHRGEIDEKSSEFLKEFASVGTSLIAFKKRQEIAAHDVGDLLKIQGPDDLVVEDVKACGAVFTPQLSFSPRLSKVVLQSITNTAIDKFDALKVYEALCEIKQEQFGPADSATLDEKGRRRVWKFPKTEVTVSYEKKTSYTTQYFNGQDQLRPSTTEHLTITYDSKEASRTGDRLRIGEELLPGDQLTSGNSQFRFQVQGNGNAVVIKPESGDVMWSSNTGGKGVRAFRLSDEGNVEAVAADGRVTWSTETSSATKTELVMQDDGNLVLYADQVPIWASSTAE